MSPTPDAAPTTPPDTSPDTSPDRSPQNREAAREAALSAAMRAARRGDAAAYRRLLAEIAAMLRPAARRRLAQLGLGTDEAEDVVQETLIAVHAKRATWDEARPFLPWLRAIARYKLLDAARKLGRTRRATVDAPVEDWADLLAAPAPERDMAGVSPERLVATLPERERGVVTALAFEGASVSALAAREGVGEPAVRVAFHRALKRLHGKAA